MRFQQKMRRVEQVALGGRNGAVVGKHFLDLEEGIMNTPQQQKRWLLVLMKT